MIKITYLGHSGFLVELKTAYLLFDFYKGTIPELKAEKHLYVFASHAHFDHYVKDIFTIRKSREQVSYILSADIESATVPEGQNPVFVGPNKEITVGMCHIRTLCSTDEGVAFLIQCSGTVLYHAGDLNWWHWEEEGDAFNTMMCRHYQYEISKINGEKIDIAFVPVDPRLAEQYYWGLDYFMKQTETRVVFPMHFWKRYEVFDKLGQQTELNEYRDRIYRIEKEGQVYLIEEM